MSTPASAARRTATLALTAAVSLALHAGGFALAARIEPRPAQRPPPLIVDFEAVPPPAAPTPLAAPPPTQRPRATRVAAAALPPPAIQARPPSPGPAPPESPRARPVPRVGVSLSSTTTAGGFAVGAGNTLLGRAAEIASDPGTADGTEPGSRASAQPRLLERPEIPYPAQARRAGAKGRVLLLLRIDAAGRVAAARVIADPGAGLGEAARTAALRFRFAPALLEGEPVETEIRFTYNFVLE